MGISRRAVWVDRIRGHLHAHARPLHRALRPCWRQINRWLGIESYWAGRSHLRYYREIVDLARVHAPDGGTVLDVGAATTEVILALDWFERKTVLDLNPPLRRAGVASITADFMSFEADAIFDLVLCLQVVEHVPDPAAFIRKLLATGRVLILSVPHKWEAGRTPGHRHDPIDGALLQAWSGRAPLETRVVREEGDRLIAVYRSDSFTAPTRAFAESPGGVRGSPPVPTPAPQRAEW